MLRGGIIPVDISVTFNLSLKRYAGTEDGKIKVKMPEGATVKQLLNNFKVIPGEVGLIIINSEIAKQETVLKDKDELELYPVVGGG
jgi:sulfur carrier protein ThiS